VISFKTTKTNFDNLSHVAWTKIMFEIFSRNKIEDAKAQFLLLFLV